MELNVYVLKDILLIAVSSSKCAKSDLNSISAKKFDL